VLAVNLQLKAGLASDARPVSVEGHSWNYLANFWRRTLTRLRLGPPRWVGGWPARPARDIVQGDFHQGPAACATDRRRPLRQGPIGSPDRLCHPKWLVRPTVCGVWSGRLLHYAARKLGSTIRVSATEVARSDRLTGEADPSPPWRARAPSGRCGGTKSTGTPSRSSSSCWTPMMSMMLVPGGKSTSISTSLPSWSSPRAALPKISGFVTPWRRSTSYSSRRCVATSRPVGPDSGRRVDAATPVTAPW